ncbi:MAG: NUDIX hydrolase [Candidatus Dormibacteraeota bacterium]|nr:NUDIX hydrolase [Candidatus Dormibacteraeota bacterium]
MTADPIDPLRETVVERRSLHQGRILHVFDDQVRLEDGRLARRELVEHPGAVCIVAVDEQGRIGMVRQWRHPAGRALWELPAGTRDHPGEATAATASRELREEMEASAATWRYVGAWPLAPGYSSEVMHFYLAGGIAAWPGASDPEEQLERAWFTPDEARERIREGKVDVKTIAGLALAGYTVAPESEPAAVGADG